MKCKVKHLCILYYIVVFARKMGEMGNNLLKSETVGIRNFTLSNTEVLKIQQVDQLLSTTGHKNIIKDISNILMLSEMGGF